MATDNGGFIYANMTSIKISKPSAGNNGSSTVDILRCTSVYGEAANEGCFQQIH